MKSRKKYEMRFPSFNSYFLVFCFKSFSLPFPALWLSSACQVLLSVGEAGSSAVLWTWQEDSGNLEKIIFYLSPPTSRMTALLCWAWQSNMNKKPFLDIQWHMWCGQRTSTCCRRRFSFFSSSSPAESTPSNGTPAAWKYNLIFHIFI